MGRSRQIGSSKKHGKGRLMKVKTAHKKKDLDQIHLDLKPASRQALLNQEIDLDLPGKGQNYCLICTRHFVDKTSLRGHMKSKPHKRRLKDLSVEPYTHAEAERAAGMGNYVEPKEVLVIEQDMPEESMDEDEEPDKKKKTTE